MTIGSECGQNTQVNITERKWFQSSFIKLVSISYWLNENWYCTKAEVFMRF